MAFIKLLSQNLGFFGNFRLCLIFVCRIYLWFLQYFMLAPMVFSFSLDLAFKGVLLVNIGWLVMFCFLHFFYNVVGILYELHKFTLRSRFYSTGFVEYIAAVCWLKVIFIKLKVILYRCNVEIMALIVCFYSAYDEFILVVVLFLKACNSFYTFMKTKRMKNSYGDCMRCVMCVVYDFVINCSMLWWFFRFMNNIKMRLIVYDDIVIDFLWNCLLRICYNARGILYQ